MNKCIKCGSYAFNLYKDGIDQGGLCDVHYWQGRAHRAEALAEQPAQHVLEVRVWRDKNHDQHAEFRGYDKLPDGEHVFYTSPPAQRTWVGLTQDEFRDFASTLEYGTGGLIRAIEAKLKEKNT